MLIIQIISCSVFDVDVVKQSQILFILTTPGPSLSSALVNAGITTFKKIEETNPRELELVRSLFLATRSRIA